MFNSFSITRVLPLLSLLLLHVLPTAAGGGITFHDIAADDGAGIHYRHTLAVTITNLMKQHGAPGVALLDYDHDGDLDIYATNGLNAANSLYRNQFQETGQLTFIDVAVDAGVDAADQDSTGVCYGDTDNDGDHDLLVLAQTMPNRLFENQGNGTFADITASSGIGVERRSSSWSCAMGDVNGDGLLDILIGGDHLFNEDNQLFLNAGSNVFSDATTSANIGVLADLPTEQDAFSGITWAVAMADYDLDGDVDIFTATDQPVLGPGANQEHGIIRLFQNDGQGYFTDVTAQAGLNRPGFWMGLAFGDLNRDGYMDFFGTNVGDYFFTLGPGRYNLGDAASLWFLGRPDGAFDIRGVGGLVATPFGWGVSMADYDNDGDTDILYHGGLETGPYIDRSNPGAILQNDGAANFTRDAAALATSTDHRWRNVQGMAVGDLNNDGFVDVVSVSDFNIPSVLPLRPFRVNYDGAFDADAAYVEGRSPTGQPIPYEEGTLSVEINSGGNGNHWVKVQVMGAHDLIAGGRVNRDGIGAVIFFTPIGGATVMQPVLGGSSYASQDSLIASFGLGMAETGMVEVLWPGGARNRLYDVHASEFILFPEIPCSFTDDWANEAEFDACLTLALNEFVEQLILTSDGASRFRESMMRAFHE